MPNVWDDFFPITADAERKEAQAKEQVRQVNLAECMRKVMDSYEGRTVMRWILDRADAFGAQYCQDAGEASFREGRKWVAMEILKMCQRAGVAARLLDSEENNG